MMRKLLNRLLGVTMKTTLWLTLARLALSLGKKALKKR